ncbi:MAG: cation:proton antiporter subunit C [Alphaproteobacteria bacterium]|nr:cation:proton antiporter subunit C [Alphaproteobacteria bacterium]
MEFPGLYNYWITIVLMMVGFYIVIAHDNLIKKVVGLNIFQVSVFVFYISMAKVQGGTAPILDAGIETYSNPLPHVLILTAIVVAVATTALALALVVRIRNAYGTIEDDEIEGQEDDA